MELSSISDLKRYGIKIHKKVSYKKGFEEKIAQFLSFTDSPIKAGFSWGKGTKSMSFFWNEFGGEGEEIEGQGSRKIKERVVGFLGSLGIDYTNNGIVGIIGVYEKSQDQLEAVEITTIDLDLDETGVKANFVYTSDPNIAIIIRPADCPVSVIYAKPKDGRKIAGLIHSSGIATNAGVPRASIKRLLEEESVELDTIKIGITPGISYKNFSTQEIKVILDDEGLDADGQKVERMVEVVEDSWKDHIGPRVTGLPTERRQVDILGATIMQFIEAGIKPSQIEAYDIDTWDAMEKGESFSDQYYKEMKKRGTHISPGRYIVAVGLASQKS